MAVNSSEYLVSVELICIKRSFSSDSSVCIQTHMSVWERSCVHLPGSICT